MLHRLAEHVREKRFRKFYNRFYTGFLEGRVETGQKGGGVSRHVISNSRTALAFKV